MARLVALFVPLPIIKSPVAVIGDKALNPAAAVVWPVPPLAIPIVGMSAVVSDLKVGAAEAPLLGPAKMTFTAWVVNVPVSVPLPVTGDPETVMIDGSAKATEVT
jgi:hypothetical protein